MAADVIDVILYLRNVAQFVSQSKKSSDAIGKVGTEAEKSGKKAQIGWKGVAKWAGGAAAVYAGFRFLKGATSAVEEHGKAVLALHRTTGLDIKTSSEWTTVLKARGQQVKPFQMGLTKLSREAEKSRLGTMRNVTQLAQLRKEYKAVSLLGGKDAPKALARLQTKMDTVTARGRKQQTMWRALGVSQEAIRRGDIGQIMLQAADGFHRIRRPTERAAYAQQLFARQGRELAPIFFKGSAAIRKQLATAGKYAHFNAKNTADVAKQIQRQREMKMAYEGLQLSIGTALLPVMLTFSQLILRITDLLQPLIHNSTALEVAIGLLVIAFIAWKVAMIASTIAAIAFDGAMAPALLTIGAIALALIAVGVAAYFVIKHWDWVKKKAIEVFGWIKAHWPLLVGILLGPFGLAVAEIIHHWDQIQAGAVRAFNIIKRVVKGAIDFVVRQWDRLKSLPGSLLSKIPGGGAASKAFGGVASVFGGQHGGIVPRRSPVLVGEAGPELLHLPGGARVVPLPVDEGSAGMGETVVHTHVYLDRREIALAVGRYTADRVARR